MKTHEITGNLYQLTRLFWFNNYLVREDDGFTMIDTNMGGSAESIVKAAAEIGAPIKRIVLTHAHNDHVASLDELHALLPDAEVMISERDARFLAGDMSLDPDEPLAKLRGGYTVQKTKPTRLLHDGDEIGSLRAIAAPGHTPGQMAFMDTRDNTLIAGDAFQTQAGIAVSGVMKILFPFPAMATWYKPYALRTAKHLRDLKPVRLAVGHGPVLENPIIAMDDAIKQAESDFEPLMTETNGVL